MQLNKIPHTKGYHSQINIFCNLRLTLQIWKSNDIMNKIKLILLSILINSFTYSQDLMNQNQLQSNDSNSQYYFGSNGYQGYSIKNGNTTFYQDNQTGKTSYSQSSGNVTYYQDANGNLSYSIGN